MPTIKIYPPSQLPDREVSETQFSIWKEELEVYLSQDKEFEVFLPGEKYPIWNSAENSPNRVTTLHPDDVPDLGENATPNEVETANAEVLQKINKGLRTVLSIVGKCVAEGHYNSVIRHSTSLQSIYDMLRSDYDIQQKGIHFFNILDVKYAPIYIYSTIVIWLNIVMYYRTLVCFLIYFTIPNIK